MCCQVLLDHIFGCDIMSNTHRLVQVIPGVQCAQHWHFWSLSLRLLQCIKIIRLPGDTFARRRLRVMPGLGIEWIKRQQQQLALRWGYVFLERHGFSVESSWRSISSNLLLWKQNDSSVVMWTWSWRGKHAASAAACLREANTEH